MKIETIKKANALMSELAAVEEQIKLWSKPRKGNIRYTYNTASYKEVGGGSASCIPDAVFEAFRAYIIDALKAKRFKIAEELDNLTD